jgi:hypothetical protein
VPQVTGFNRHSLHDGLTVSFELLCLENLSECANGRF